MTSVIITTAVELPESTFKDLIKKIEKEHGEVQLKLRVDPQVLGGMSVMIGSQLYDATFAGKLDRITTELTKHLQQTTFK